MYCLLQTKDVIFFGDKVGTIGIWDARATPDDHEDDADGKVSAEDGQYWSLQVRMHPMRKVATH
jgi:hypothetical protein